jgi:Tfp pilus assembly PilM family ATPase
MATLTAIVVSERALGLVSGRKTPTGIELARAVTAPLPEDFAVRTTEQRAEAVKEALAKLGGADRHVALVLPRAAAVMRDFELPAAETEELQMMVRFQMERELPMPVEQVRYAYVTSPAAEGRLKVSSVAVPNEQLDGWMKAFEAAGVTVTSAYVSSFGLASLVSGDAGAALVSVADKTAEILVLEGSHLAFSRSAPVRDEAPAALADEVERTILSYASKSGGKEVPSVLVAGEGGDAEKIATGLSSAMTRKVTRLSLNGDVTRRDQVTVGMETAAAAGVVVGVLRGKPALPDVLVPPITRKKFKLTPRHRMAILGGLIVVLGFAWAEMWVRGLQSKNDALSAEIGSLKPKNDAVLRLEADTALVGKWTQGSRLTWARKILTIKRKIESDKLFVLTMTLDDTGILSMTGKCINNDAVNDFVGELTKAKLLATDKSKTSFASIPGAKDKYKTSFTLSSTLDGFEKPGAKK